MSHVRLHALALRGWGLGTESICVCGKAVGVGGGELCWLILERTAKETVSRFSHSLIPNNQEALLGHNQKTNKHNKKQIAYE